MDSRRAQRLRCPPLRWLCATAVGGIVWAGLPGFALGACGRSVGTVEPIAVDERLDVTLADGRIVRLGGLDPSSAGGSSALARASGDFLTHLLVGRPVTLFLLASGNDRWGRTVADIVPEGAAGQSAADALLEAGFARVRPEFEARSCAPARLRVEDAAREARRGVWADPAFLVIDASDRPRLRQHDGQFVLLEGKVRRVGFGRSRLYLDLNARGGTTIIVNRKLEPVLARAGRPVGALQGRTVRARGALDTRFGPRIEIQDPAMLEILRDTAPAVVPGGDVSGDEAQQP